MAKKDFDKYFNEQRAAYYNAIKVLEEYGTMAADKMISTDDMKQAEQILAPTIETYKMLVYIKSILDRPNRKEKVKKYNIKNKKQLDNQYNSENIKNKNKELLSQFKEEYLHDERNTQC